MVQRFFIFTIQKMGEPEANHTSLLSFWNMSHCDYGNEHFSCIPFLIHKHLNSSHAVGGSHFWTSQFPDLEGDRCDMNPITSLPVTQLCLHTSFPLQALRFSAQPHSAAWSWCVHWKWRKRDKGEWKEEHVSWASQDSIGTRMRDRIQSAGSSESEEPEHWPWTGQASKAGLLRTWWEIREQEERWGQIKTFQFQESGLSSWAPGGSEGLNGIRTRHKQLLGRLPDSRPQAGKYKEQIDTIKDQEGGCEHHGS